MTVYHSAIAAFTLTNVQVIYMYVYVLYLLNAPCLSLNMNMKLSTAVERNDFIAKGPTVRSHKVIWIMRLYEQFHRTYCFHLHGGLPCFDSGWYSPSSYRADSQFITGSAHLTFVVKRLAKGQFILRLIQCDSVTNILPMLRAHSLHTPYQLSNWLTYLLHGAESFLRS